MVDRLVVLMYCLFNHVSESNIVMFAFVFVGTLVKSNEKLDRKTQRKN